MPLQTYCPHPLPEPFVTIGRNGKFHFNASARDQAALYNAQRCLIHVDAEERRIVFEPLQEHQLLERGIPARSLKVTHDYATAAVSVKARGLLSQEPWIRAIADLPRRQNRKFLMRPFDSGARNMWSIVLPKEAA